MLKILSQLTIEELALRVERLVEENPNPGLVSRLEVRLASDGQRRAVSRFRTEQEIVDDFLRKIRINQETRCWEWVAANQRNRYGVVRINKIKHLAHRLMYEFYIGAVPDGLFVCHHCDNPPCVNPEHLFAGTHTDNMRDMRLKGRQGSYDKSGDRNPAAKLTNDDAIKIRELYSAGIYRQRDIADQFGVTQTCIGNIVLRKTFSNI